MQATIRLLSERKGGEFFLDIPSYRAHREAVVITVLHQDVWNSSAVGHDLIRKYPKGKYLGSEPCNSL
jgi:hypothetical protein